MVLGAGCATPGPIAPQYLDPSFVPAGVQELTILPIADIRIDRSQTFNFQAFAPMGQYHLRRLKRWGYAVSFAKDFGEIQDMSNDDLTVADPSWVMLLGPKGVRWIFLVALEDIASLTTFGKAVGVECLGILFDKMSGKTMWRHETIGEERVGGGIIGAIGGWATPQQWVIAAAFRECIYGLIKQFPAKN
jgi:hypothetical protein